MFTTTHAGGQRGRRAQHSESDSPTDSSTQQTTQQYAATTHAHTLTHTKRRRHAGGGEGGGERLGKRTCCSSQSPLSMATYRRYRKRRASNVRSSDGTSVVTSIIRLRATHIHIQTHIHTHIHTHTDIHMFVHPKTEGERAAAADSVCTLTQSCGTPT